MVQSDVDPGGGVSVINSQNHGCGFVSKFSSSGVFQWVKTMEGEGEIGISAKGIETDGSIYCVIAHTDTIDQNTFGIHPIEPDTLGNMLYNNNSFFLKLDSNGVAINYIDLHSGNMDRQDILFPDPNHFYYAGELNEVTDMELGPAILNAGPTVLYNNQFFLSYYSFDSQTSRVTGKSFVDQNSDGIFNYSDVALQNAIVKISPDSIFTSTDNYGDYTAYLDTGSYTIEIPDYPISLSAPVPLMQSVNFTSANQLDTAKNFTFSFISNTRDLAVHLTQYGFARAAGNMNYKITFSNNGSSNQSGVVELTLDTTLVLINSSIAPTTVTGNVLQWNYSTLKPFESRDIQLTVAVSINVNFNDSIRSSVNITPLNNDVNPLDNSDASSIAVMGSYDPNLKEVYPHGNIMPSFITAGDYLTYTIHFQNTGNDTAFNITVLDTLSSKYDLTSFKLISSSHPCQFKLYKDNLAEFKFRNILLPDSTTDEAGSNGFVKYQLKPLASLTAGDTIENRAFIYFDHNDPIATNTAQTIIETPVFIANANQNAVIKIYPNPANEHLTIEDIQRSISYVQLVDIFGKECSKQKSNSSSPIQMNIKHLSAGFYFLKTFDKNGNLISTNKLVKE